MAVQHSKAHRLARTVVGDFFLYNGEQIDEGLLNDDLFERLEGEIDDSVSFFRQHVGSKMEIFWDTMFNKLMERESKLLEKKES